jgi:hypothetical protein
MAKESGESLNAFLHFVWKWLSNVELHLVFISWK